MELPPYRGELQGVRIVKTGESVRRFESIVANIQTDNARGNFNELSPGEAGFSNLASESGKRFFQLLRES